MNRAWRIRGMSPIGGLGTFPLRDSLIGLLFVIVPPVTLADSVLPAVGSTTGGRQFTARCEVGEFMSGMAIRAGAEIDAVAPICARAESPTTLAPDSQRTYPKAFGGPGGTEGVLQCLGETPAIRAVNLVTRASDDRVRDIAIYCGPVSDAPWARPEHPAAKYVGDQERQGLFARFLGVGLLHCPDGEVVVGLHGRSGARVDSLGIICGPPIVTAPVPPPPVEPRTSDRVNDMMRQREPRPPTSQTINPESRPRVPSQPSPANRKRPGG